MHNLPTNEDDTREIIAFYNLENLFSPSTNKEQKRQNKFSGANNWNTERYQKIDKIGQVFSEIAKYNGLLPKILPSVKLQENNPYEIYWHYLFSKIISISISKVTIKEGLIPP